MANPAERRLQATGEWSGEGIGFSDLSVADIYGKEVSSVAYARQVLITEEMFKRGDWKKTFASAVAFSNHQAYWNYRRLLVAKANGFEGTGSLSIEDGQYLLSDVLTDTMANWFPSFDERRTILAIAQAVSPDKKPVILDAGCGTGFNTALLAQDGFAETIGVDPHRHSQDISRVPLVAGSRFLNQDLWNHWDQFSPKYSKDIHWKRVGILDRIRNEIYNHGFYQDSTDPETGTLTRFINELETLQGLAQEPQEESPVDVVLASFMQQHVDLTLPIRDGIYPKVIIYARPVDGTSGSTDYYTAEFDKTDEYQKMLPARERREFTEAAAKIPDMLASYNPGRNYRTYQRWQAPYYKDWSNFTSPSLYGLGAEVIVQVRKDVALPQLVDDFQIQRYTFDDEIEALVRKVGL